MMKCHRRCTWLTWRLGCAPRNRVSFHLKAISGVVPLRACWMDASFAWVKTSPKRHCIIQRRCWSHLHRGQRVRPAGSVDTCPA